MHTCADIVSPSQDTLDFRPREYRQPPGQRDTEWRPGSRQAWPTVALLSMPASPSGRPGDLPTDTAPGRMQAKPLATGQRYMTPLCQHTGQCPWNEPSSIPTHSIPGSAAHPPVRGRRGVGPPVGSLKQCAPPLQAAGSPPSLHRTARAKRRASGRTPQHSPALGLRREHMRWA